MCFFFFFHQRLHSSFWTSRGHRCRPVFPPVLAFNCYRAEGSAIPLLVVFHGVLLTHALALSASQVVHKKKSPRIYTSMHSGRFELTKLTYTRLEDNLIRLTLTLTPPGRLFGPDLTRQVISSLSSHRCSSSSISFIRSSSNYPPVPRRPQYHLRPAVAPTPVVYT